MTQAKPTSFNIGRKGFPSSQPVSNLDMCHLQEVETTLSDGCEVWEHLHGFREVQCLQGSSTTFMDGYIKFYSSS